MWKKSEKMRKIAGRSGWCVQKSTDGDSSVVAILFERVPRGNDTSMILTDRWICY